MRFVSVDVVQSATAFSVAVEFIILLCHVCVAQELERSSGDEDDDEDDDEDGDRKGDDVYYTDSDEEARVCAILIFKVFFNFNIDVPHTHCVSCLIFGLLMQYREMEDDLEEIYSHFKERQNILTKADRKKQAGNLGLEDEQPVCFESRHNIIFFDDHILIEMSSFWCVISGGRRRR